MSSSMGGAGRRRAAHDGAIGVRRRGRADTAAVHLRRRGGGFDVDCAVMAPDVVARALVSGDTRGLIKLVRELGTGRLVGASVLAAGAPDVIQSAVLAIQHGITVEALTRTWAPYLTMAEGFKLAAQSFDRDVTKLSCCT
jgi:mercuric reductase